jgi:hypothetical protein
LNSVKIRVEVDVNAYDSLVKGEFYNHLLLKQLGISLPAEKE